MKTIIAFVTLATVAFAAPPVIPEQAVVVKEFPSDNVGLGSYNYAYQLSDGQMKQENADVIEGGTEGSFLRISGSYSYVDPHTDVTYKVHYVADENGFHPQGEHLPSV